MNHSTYACGNLPEPNDTVEVIVGAELGSISLNPGDVKIVEAVKTDELGVGIILAGLPRHENDNGFFPERFKLLKRKE